MAGIVALCLVAVIFAWLLLGVIFGSQPEPLTAELRRIEAEIRKATEQVDRLEAEALHVLYDIAGERFEEHW